MIKTIKVSLDELLDMFENQFGHKLSGVEKHGHPACALKIWCEGVNIADGNYEARFNLRTGELEFSNLKDSGRWGLERLFLHAHPEVESVLSVENPYYSEEFLLRVRMRHQESA